MCILVHCKFLPHENNGDLESRGRIVQFFTFVPKIVLSGDPLYIAEQNSSCKFFKGICRKIGTKVRESQQNSTSGAIFHRCIGMMMTCRAIVLTSPLPFCCYSVYCLLLLHTYSHYPSIMSLEACFRTHFLIIFLWKQWIEPKMFHFSIDNSCYFVRCHFW